MTGSSKKSKLFDLDGDLPTSKNDVERLWELSNRLDFTSLEDANRLLDPFWTLEKAKAQLLFDDNDEPLRAVR